MANYVSLDDAAKILGLSPDELVEMRSRGEIFGYRDGSSWKFKAEEIERVQSELGGDALDEDAGGSSLLISERQVGPSGSKSGSVLGPGSSSVGLGNEASDDNRMGSDVALVPDPKSGSGLRLVNRPPAGPAQGSSLELADDNNLGDMSGVSDLQLQDEGGSGSEVELGSDLKLMADGTAGESGLDLLSKDSNVLGSDIALQSGSSGGTPEVTNNSKGSSGSLSLGGSLELASDDEDDLVLGSDSGVGLGSESGINLMSPSDSGLSLEDEPLDLAGTGISGLDLGAEVASGSGSGGGVGSGSGLSGLGSGALIDFQQGEEFQLTPSSGGIEVDDDSGSQVIELEDSSEFGAMPAEGGFELIQEGGGFDQGDGFGDEAALASGAMAGAAMRGVPETPYGTLEIVTLLGILLLLSFSGLFVSDLMRNMWAWDGQNNYTSSLTETLGKLFAR